MYAKDKYDKQKYFDKYGKYKGQLYDGKFYNPIGKLQWTIIRDGENFTTLWQISWSNQEIIQKKNVIK